MELVGEVLADVMGLNKSHYQWVIDSVAEDQRRAKHREEVEESRRQLVEGHMELREAAAAEGAEAGVGDGEENGEGA